MLKDSQQEHFFSLVNIKKFYFETSVTMIYEWKCNKTELQWIVLVFYHSSDVINGKNIAASFGKFYLLCFNDYQRKVTIVTM